MTSDHLSTFAQPDVEAYRALAEHLPFGVAMINHAGRILVANPATAHMLGHGEKAGVTLDSFLDLFPAANRDHIAGLITRAFAGERMEVEYSLVVCGRRRVF